MKKIDRREFIIAAVCTAAGCADIGAGEKQIAHFGMATDMHYADLPNAVDDPGERCYRDAPAKLRDCIDTLNARKVDFLIELGDFKDMMPTKEATLKCLDDIERVFSRFNGPRYHVLGNHETDCLTKAEFLSHVANAGQEKALAHYSFTAGDVTFVVLDPNYTSKMEDYRPGNFDFRDANVPPGQVKWIEDVLAVAPGPVVVFSHQLVDPVCPDVFRIRNAAQLREMFEKSGKVKAVFTGHHHVGHRAVHNGIFYYTLRAISQDAYPENNSYAEVTMYDSGRIVVKGFVKAASAMYTSPGFGMPLPDNG